MNLEEFERRLTVDPRDNSADMQAARLAGGEDYRRAAERAGAFDDRLRQALSVPAPSELAETVIRRRDAEPERVRGAWYRPRIAFAMAASVLLAVVLGVILLRSFHPSPSDDLAGYLAWHWSLDGEHALEMMEDGVPEARLEQFMAEFNLDLGPALHGDVRFVKLCPAPDGQGLHLVLATESGPVTLFYLPGLDSGGEIQMQVNGMEVWVTALETGAVAVIASPEQPLDSLAALVRDEFRVSRL